MKIITKIITKFFIFCINLYQLFISPLIGKNCKFYPSCSNYAKEAIVTKGIIIGICKTVYRIIRCNPFTQGGFDPVEQERKK